MQAGFHAEAPMRLESVIQKSDDFYTYEINKTIRFQHTIEQIVNDIQKNIATGIIAAKFHNTIIESGIEVIQKIRKETKINKVVLSGGSFQNRYLLENFEEKLTEIKFNVFSPFKIPANDGGIALGQMIIGKNKS